MLKNPILKDMAVEDLNQRYRDTYILYNQVPYYTYGFRKSQVRGVRVEINLCEMADIYKGDNGNWKAFNWELLDVSRPEAGWYSFNGVLSHVSYLMNKQYSRGVCAANTYIRKMNGDGGTQADYFDLLQQQLGPRKQFAKKTMATIKVEHQAQGFSLLNRQVSIHARNVRVNMQSVGKLTPDLDAFIMTRPMYKIELEDRVIDPVFKEVDVKAEKYTDFDDIIKKLKLEQQENVRVVNARLARERAINQRPVEGPLNIMDDLDQFFERGAALNLVHEPVQDEF